MGHLAKPRDASFFRVFFNPYRYGVLTVQLWCAYIITGRLIWMNTGSASLFSDIY